MQSTLREKYSRSLSAPESITSQEAKLVFKSALQHAVRQYQEESTQQTVVVNESEAVEAYTELGQELVAVSTQIGENRDSKIKEIITRIYAAVSHQSIDEVSTPFFEAIESMVNREITVDTFVNVMVFCITLVRSYRNASPTSWEDRTVWIAQQVSILMAAAYQRYHIDDWIQEQGGWTGVLRLVRKKYQTVTDYATGGRGFTTGQKVAAGAGVAGIAGIIALVAIWYNS